MTVMEVRPLVAPLIFFMRIGTQKASSRSTVIVTCMCAYNGSCVLQCVAVCCSVLQCVAVCCSVLQCVVATFMCVMGDVYCSVLQQPSCVSCLMCIAVCCSYRAAPSL